MPIKHTTEFFHNAYSLKDIPETLIPLKAGIYTASWAMARGALFIPIELSDEPFVDVGGISKTITTDIEKFLGARKKYQKHNMPHKRGYLLHGEPGCGKTSIIRSIQRKFRDATSGFVLNITPGDSPQGYYRIVRNYVGDVPIMFVIEDLDSIGDNDEMLLSFLDGAEKIDNVIFLFTTNYLDKVPPRLKNRPSRIDRLFEIKPPSYDERKIYLKTLEPHFENTDSMLEISEDFSFAQLKELYISVRILDNDLKETAARIREAGTNIADDDNSEPQPKAALASPRR